MINIEISDEGFADVLGNLEAVTPALSAFVVGRGLRAAARVVANEAKGLVPVKTGALRDSIRAAYATTVINTSTGRRRVAGTGAIVQVGNRRGVTGAAHAVLVEYGTVRSKAQPFMEPAAMTTTAQQLSAAGRAARLAYNRLASSLAAGPDAPSKRIRRLAAL